jgi:hypothetical protein
MRGNGGLGRCEILVFICGEISKNWARRLCPLSPTLFFSGLGTTSTHSGICLVGPCGAREGGDGCARDDRAVPREALGMLVGHGVRI